MTNIAPAFVVLTALGLSACATTGGAPTLSQTDLDADGQVTRAEFAQVWGDADRRFNFADANGDDVISRSEFWRTQPFARKRLLPRRDR